MELCHHSEKEEGDSVPEQKLALGHFISMAALIISGLREPPVVFSAIDLSMRRISLNNLVVCMHARSVI